VIVLDCDEDDICTSILTSIPVTGQLTDVPSHGLLIVVAWYVTLCWISRYYWRVISYTL